MTTSSTLMTTSRDLVSRLVVAVPDGAERRRARLWLLLVCLGIVVLHVVVVGLDRPINWDEAIHVTQVNPARPAVFMEPHRTRGLSLLAAPIVVFDPSMVVMRALVALAIAAGTFGAYAVWIPLIGTAAPIAAAVHASYWVTVFYSVEVLPNQPAALLAVAFTGLVARRIAAEPVGGAASTSEPVGGAASTSLTWWLAGTVAVFAAVRPPDAVLVGVGVAAIALLVRRRDAVAILAPAAIGGVVGIVPWLVEGWVRFGLGPVGTVRSAGEYSVEVAAGNLLPLYLRSLEARLRCAGACVEDAVADGLAWELPPARTTLFLGVALLLGVIAVAVARQRWWVVLAPIAAAVPLLWFYGVAGGAMNLRYLLPVYALLLLPPAIGLRAVAAAVGALPRPVATGVRSMMALTVAVACVWSIQIAVERFERTATRDRAWELGQQLAAVADPPCVVVSRVNYPQIQYWSGCLATAAGRAQDGELQPPLGELGSYVDVAAAAAAGAEVFAIDREELRDSSPLRGWDRVDPFAEPVDGYVLYRHRDGAPLPPPPCPPDGGPDRTLGGVLSPDC